MPMSSDKVDAATIEDLRHLAIFAQMTEPDLVRFLALGQAVDAEAGAVLMDQGDVGLECFFVISGEAGIFSGPDHLATIGSGSIVGEMALIGHRPRNASVVAQGPMRLLSFDIEHFRELLDEMPDARDHVMAVLQARAAQNKSADES
ncbi:MAG: cyclic nucleotide-binding domain-containing protein [Acidimicrobiia bacterium]|nr:cyclic nucleotide-binding domain-containing protein [Acidimicrobiia bacterium]